MDIDIAHHAIVRHYKLQDSPDPKSVKLPRGVYSLMRSDDINKIMNDCSTDTLAMSIQMNMKNTKYTYNSIVPRTQDYMM